MRKIGTDRLLPGMVIARSVFTSEGRVLLSAGMEIREGYQDKFASNGITDIYIEDNLSRDIAVADVVQEQTRSEAKSLVRNLMNGIRFTNCFNETGVRKVVEALIEDLLQNREILVNLADLRTVDDYTFAHSVNVCILSLITAIGLGYSRQRLRDLGIGALMHDIGKLRVPEEILKKPSQLTVEEFEEIKRHTVYGYELLKDHSAFNMTSAFIAFGHHERFDGSGYPLQLRGENIHEFARIVAAADVYDALSSDRVYRKKLRPHEVVEYITSLGCQHFDQNIVGCFVKYIAVYPEGTGVILNTRERGIVVSSNPEEPTRPVVRIIYNARNERLAAFQEIDLSKKPGLFILDICDI